MLPADIASALARFPTLRNRGFEDDSALPLDFRDDDVRTIRMVQVLIRRYFAETKTTQPLGSYGLKHLAERLLGAYVSNGAFILAAILEGVRVSPNGGRDPNARFKFRIRDKRLLQYWRGGQTDDQTAVAICNEVLDAVALDELLS
jgi:hypothetical protein